MEVFEWYLGSFLRRDDWYLKDFCIDSDGSRSDIGVSNENMKKLAFSF